MAEWATTTLGELVANGTLIMSDGYRTKRGELGRPGFRIIRVADVGDGSISLDSPDFVSEAQRPQIGAKLGRSGDILLTTKGTVGRVAVLPEVDEPVVYSPQLCFFRVVNETHLTRLYLRYWFSSPEFLRQASDRMNNTDMAAYINLGDIRSLRLSLPEPVEQRAIAEVLGALDDKIAANTRLAAATDEYLATLFDRALRSSDVREARLDDVALINVRSVNPGEGDLRYIDIAAVGEGHYAFPDVTPWATAPSRARRAVGHGDTLWSTVRPNRRSHALNLSSDPLLAASTGLAVLSPKSVGFAYLYEVARRPEFSAYLETVAEGSAYPAVRAERFATAPVPMIEDCARQKFEEIAAPLREHMHAHAIENRALAATRDALLPALMSGALRVRDAERAVEQVV